MELNGLLLHYNYVVFLGITVVELVFAEYLFKILEL